MLAVSAWWWTRTCPFCLRGRVGIWRGWARRRYATPSGTATPAPWNCGSNTPAEHLVRLCVQDDGCGFDPFAPHPDGYVHFGLKAMRSRVERLGGQFAIESRLQGGTTVTAVIPASSLSLRSHARPADTFHHPSLDH